MKDGILMAQYGWETTCGLEKQSTVDIEMLQVNN